MGLAQQSLRVSNRRSHYAAARCQRCHRPLTDPVSIRLGMGPECRGRSGRSSVDNGLCVRDEFSDAFDNTIQFEQALVLKRQRRSDRPYDPNDPGQAVTNVPHLVVHHSPDGYEFGYGGSGPSDLALNCCQLYLNMADYEGQQTKCYDGSCWSLAYALRHEFKSSFIASTPSSGRVIPFAEIDGWFKSKLTSDLLALYEKEKP
jgi:uncharacterized protein DUF6011/uncharacterized protein DUF6166